MKSLILRLATPLNPGYMFVCFSKQLTTSVSHHLFRRPPSSNCFVRPTCLLAASALFQPAASFSNKIMPSLPLKYESTDTDLDLTGFSEGVQKTEERRQQAYDYSRLLQQTIVTARKHIGEAEATKPLRDLVAQDKEDAGLINPKDHHPRQPRLANLSNRIEDMLRLEAYQHFLETGRLIPLSSLSSVYSCTDEEYLSGACMGLCQELQRYGLGRATVRDLDSVQAATAIVTDCQDFLLQLDFRNGPLRRRFDGNKYSLKALETLQYELAITGGDSEEPDSKRAKLEGEKLVPTEELDELKKRMDHRDELREKLIKRCRDSQKAAKQAIFALHRGDTKRTKQLLHQCCDAIQKDLLPLVQEDPSLRTSGSYSGVLEEYVEARLFAAWLHGEAFFGEKAGDDEPAQLERPVGVLLTAEDFGEVSLEPAEYLGGLCDLTGEVGRFAVQRGTARDGDSVRLCLQTNSAIYTALESLGRLPSGNISKKMEAVRRSIEKLERMLYEMSLSEAAGGRDVKSDMDAVKEEDAS